MARVPSETEAPGPKKPNGNLNETPRPDAQPADTTLSPLPSLMKFRYLLLAAWPALASAQLDLDALKQVGSELLQTEGGQMLQDQVMAQMAPGGMLDPAKAEGMVTAMMGEGAAADTVSQLLQALQSDQFGQAVSLFQSMQGLELSPEQTQLWNMLKTEASAYVMRGEFDYQNSAFRPQIDNVITALRSGDTMAVGQTMGQLSRAAELTPEQISMLLQLRDSAAPLVEQAVNLMSPQGG